MRTRTKETGTCKRLLALMLTLCMVFSMFPAVVHAEEAVAEPVNLLADGDFENGKGEWTRGTATTDPADEGNGVLKATWIASKNLYLNDGNYYQLTFKYKADAEASRQANVRVVDYAADGTVLSTPYSLNDRLYTNTNSDGWYDLDRMPTEWKDYDFYFKANANGSTDYAYSVLEIRGRNSNNFYLDDVVLYDCGALTGSNLATNGTFENVEGWDVALEGTVAQTRRDILEPAGITTWDRFNGWNFHGASEAEAGYAGNYAVKYQAPTGMASASYNYGAPFNKINVEAGKTYVASFWLNSEVVASKRTARVHFYGDTYAAGTKVTDNAISATNLHAGNATVQGWLGAATSWQRYQVEFTVPDGIDQIAYDIWFAYAEQDSTTTMGYPVYLDQLSIVEKQAPVVEEIHTHTWTDATCTAPKTCSDCGATEGEALGHNWSEATCTTPATCATCGATDLVNMVGDGTFEDGKGNWATGTVVSDYANSGANSLKTSALYLYYNSRQTLTPGAKYRLEFSAMTIGTELTVTVTDYDGNYDTSDPVSNGTELGTSLSVVDTVKNPAPWAWNDAEAKDYQVANPAEGVNYWTKYVYVFTASEYADYNYSRVKVTVNNGVTYFDDVVLCEIDSEAGHDYGEGIVTSAPTCFAEGVKTYTCSLCGDSYTEAIPVVDHTWSEGSSTVTPTCSVCGQGKLTSNGVALAQILLSDNASELEVLAAEEMQSNLELVTGATLPINTGAFSNDFQAELAEDVLTVNTVDYYPVAINIQNYTDADKLVTLTHINQEAGMPELIIQGADGLADGQVNVPVGATVHVSALAAVEDPEAFTEYTARIAVNCGGQVVDTLDLTILGAGNLIAGDFETATDSWTGGERSTALYQSGNTAFQASADGNAAYSEELTLVSSDLYLMSFWTAKAIESDVKVRVRDYDAAGELLDPAVSLYSSVSANTSWTYAEYRFIANASGSENYAYSIVDFVSDGEFWLDDVALQHCGETTNTIPASTGEFEYAPTRAIQTYSFPSGTTILDEMLADGITEYDDVPGWYHYAQTHLTEDSYMGDHGAEFYTGISTSGVNLTVRNPIADEIGTYTVSFWAKGAGDGVSYGEFGLRHDYMDSADDYSESRRIYLSNEWERYEITFTPEEKGSEYIGSKFQLKALGKEREDDSGLREPLILDHLTCYNTESASVLSSSDAVQLPVGTLLDEGDFDNGAGSWTGGTVSSDGYYVASAGETMTYDVGKLRSGHTMKLSLRLMGSSTGTANIAVKDYDSEGNLLARPASLDTPRAVTTSPWSSIDLYFTPNPALDADYVKSVIEVTGTVTLSMDTAALVYCEEGTELLSNGGFESGEQVVIGEAGAQAHVDYVDEFTSAGITTHTNFSGWHFGGAGQKDTGFVGDGVKSLSPVGHASSLYTLKYQNNLTTTADTTYLISFWAKTTSDCTNPSLTVSFKDMDRAGAGTTKTWTISNVSDQWQNYQYTYTATQTGTLQNKLYFAPSTSAGTETSNGVALRNSFWIDQVSVMEVPADATEVSAEEVSVTLGAVPAIAAPQTSGLNIMICTDESLPAIESTFADDLAYLAGTDGFAVRQRGNTIYIFGDNEDGALNGAYDFLEENAGIIWLRAHDTAYKAQPTLVTQKTDYIEKPAFAQRSWHSTGVNEYGQYFADHDTGVMLRRNKMSDHTANIGMEWAFDDVTDIGLDLFHGGHNIMYWLQRSSTYQTATDKQAYWSTPNSSYYRPEYSLQENEPMESDKRQINFWNEDTITATVEAVREYLDTYPELTTVGIGLMDNYYFAVDGYSNRTYVCADGTTVEPDVTNQTRLSLNEQNKRYFSTVFFDWLNKVATELAKTHPDVKISTTAYYVTEVVPACGIHENIYVTFCPIYENLHDSYNDTTDTKYNAPTYEHYQQWINSGKVDMSQFAVYNYFGCFAASDVYERPLWDEMKAMLQCYAEDGVAHIRPEGAMDAGNSSDSEGDLNWAMNSLTYWIFGQLAWNPNADVDALIDRYCETVYGDAATYMRQYYTLLEQGWNAGTLDIQWTTSAENLYNAFVITPGVADDIQTALNNAWAAVEGQSVYQERICYIKEAFESMT